MPTHARGRSPSQKIIQARLAVSPSDLLGFLALAGTAALVLLAPRVINRLVPCGAAPCAKRVSWEWYVLLEPGALGVLLTVFFFLPRFDQAIAWLRKRWRGLYTVSALLVCFGGLAAFVFHFGNQQFGGFDFSILVDTAWRQFLGQTPYTDFVSTMPAGFNLGLKYAFDLMGPSWDSQLYATAIFACASLLWNYWLLGKLVETKLAAFLMALIIECAAILTLDFWWYNNITAVTATIFFLLLSRFSRRSFVDGCSGFVRRIAGSVGFDEAQCCGCTGSGSGLPHLSGDTA